jgi:hypothetical protein
VNLSFRKWVNALKAMEISYKFPSITENGVAYPPSNVNSEPFASLAISGYTLKDGALLKYGPLTVKDVNQCIEECRREVRCKAWQYS